MSDPILIYGATGFSGRLTTRACLAAGVRPILAGRSADVLASTVASDGLEQRVFDLSDARRLDAALDGVRVVLHMAGPYSQTARAMVEACLRTRTHYLDITGETQVVEDLAGLDRVARESGVMIMPSVGFDVVPTDCLAAHVARHLPDADTLALAMTSLAFITRGSARTAIEAAGAGFGRRHGRIVPVALASIERSFDFGDGPRACINCTWGDVANAWYTTGIPNIDVFFEGTPFLRALLLLAQTYAPFLRTAAGQVWLRAHVDLLPDGPNEAKRRSTRMVIIAQASHPDGRRKTARLHTPEAYSFTGIASAHVARRVLAGDLEPGFQTPGRVFGADFVLSLPGVWREDLD
jgi:short subunit dehydrogenase-like uncharacterized protein